MTVRMFLLQGLLGVFLLGSFFMLPEQVSAQLPAKLVPDCPATGCRACDLVQMISNVMQFIFVVSVFIAVLIIAINGFQYVVSGGSSKQLMEMLKNIIIGIILILCAWLIVDTFMKYLVGNQEFGVWNKIDCKENTVLQKKDPIAVSGAAITPAGVPGTYTPSTFNPTAPAPSAVDPTTGQTAPALGRGDCSPENIMNSARSSGYNLTQAQANTLACISNFETSGCNLGATNNSSSATGVFQITMGWNDQCHNLNLPACSQAAQTAGFSGGNLNCSNAFGAGGAIKPGMESLANTCRAAASNFNCNTAAAACLTQQRPNFSDWTNGGRHAGQQNCVNQYNR